MGLYGMKVAEKSTCFLAREKRRFGVTTEEPQETVAPVDLRYLAYVTKRNDVAVTYCKLLSLCL